MCHKGTAGAPARWVVCLLAACAAAWGQVPRLPAPEWRRVGSAAVDWRLAAPATGPVSRIWFSPEGGVLFARTQSGRIFQTADFSTWTPATGFVEPPAYAAATVVRLPEAGARVISAPAAGGRIYALGQQLYSSNDYGESWTNLTAFRSSSVVGSGLHDLAIAPSGADQLVVADDFGVWRSLDGGLTWSGLNLALPNLPVRRIVATQGPAGGTRIQVDGWGTLELAPGASVWQPMGVSDPDAALRAAYSALLGAQITAVAVAQDRVYAGSDDGRLWVVRDRVAGVPWQAAAGEPVSGIFSDPAAPDMALAALGGSGGQHVFRSTNGGLSWDALDNNLPNAAAHAITADRASGTIYVATDAGVFYGHADLQSAATDPVNWINLTKGLTGAGASVPAEDVRLDAAGTQLYIALDGYGVYATLAPHRLANPQVVSAADYSARPAAPGSLLSVLGMRVNAARAADLNYPVLAAGDGESQIQVPFEAIGPSVSLELDTATGSRTLGLAVQPVSPAILVGRDGTPALFDADTGLPLDGQNAAHSNGRVQIMATGLGKVRPSWPAGTPAPLADPPAVETSVKAFLDGNPVQVTRATLAGGYVGFYVVEVQLPLIANMGSHSLYISADGQESNRVQLVLEP